MFIHRNSMSEFYSPFSSKFSLFLAMEFPELLSSYIAFKNTCRGSHRRLT